MNQVEELEKNEISLEQDVEQTREDLNDQDQVVSELQGDKEALVKTKEEDSATQTEKEGSATQTEATQTEATQTEATQQETSQKSKKSQSNVQVVFDALLKEIEEAENTEAKLSLAVENMEKYLSQGGTPLFKYFWELRKLCLNYFKENISPGVRAVLWPKYSHLSKEARRLKEIFDEQSAFAVEQIDIALSALESDIQNFDELAMKQPDIDLKGESRFLDRKKGVYNGIQKKLNLLNTYAARINNMRKELMKTDMRIKHKNKFFQRLSSAGDQVFPVRKELIKDISEQFQADIEQFVKMNFSGEEINGLVFKLRDEVKILQGVAKILTLNTQSFTSTRLKLSECWDKLKVADKERKKVYAEKKDVFDKNKAVIEEKIHALKEQFESEALSTGAASKRIETLQLEMRKVELGRDQVKSLKFSLSTVKELIETKKKAEEEVRLEAERERLRLRKEKFNALQSKIDGVIDSADGLTHEEVEANLLEVSKMIEEVKDITGREKQVLERSIRTLKDLVNTKREEALLNLSDDDQQTLNNLRAVLSQRKERRKEIKNQYDSLRRASRSSGFDFEQAMLHNEQVNAEKELLDQADTGIHEIETKISEIKQKI